MRRLRDDITRIEQHMPHRCPETQSRAQWTRSELMARLAMLEAADGDPAPRRRCGVSA
jgi:hypothetical protein